MTRIRSFSIEGLAGRSGTISHTLQPGENVFWGLNGTGKTTLLRLLDSALQNTVEGLTTLPFRKAEVTFYSDLLDTELVRTLVKPLEDDVATDDSLLEGFSIEEAESETVWRRYVRHSELEWNTSAIGQKALPEDALSRPYRRSYLPTSRMLPSTPRSTVAARSTPDSEENFARRVNTVWSRYNARSLAKVRDIQQRGLADILAILFGGAPAIPFQEDEAVAGDARDSEANDAYEIVSKFLRAQQLILPLGPSDFMSRYEGSAPHRHVVSRIQAIQKQVDMELAPQRELQAVIDEEYIGDKHLVLTAGATRRAIGIEIGSKSIPLNSLSSGEKQLLQILVETLAVENSTILIDEPEISLHPDWQRGLVASMRRVNSGAQFILATHSPELQIDVDDDSVFEL